MNGSMPDPTPILKEKCPHDGYSCGQRGFLCDECKQRRADARAVARMALTIYIERRDDSKEGRAYARTQALALLKLCREAGRTP